MEMSPIQNWQVIICSHLKSVVYGQNHAETYKVFNNIKEGLAEDIFFIGVLKQIQVPLLIQTL